MPQFQAFDEKTLVTDLGGPPYQELLRRPGFSFGVYLLPVGGEDHQHPHAADEIYIIHSGRATLRVGTDGVNVGPGSVVSVDRGADHHFTDIVEDLTVLVLFAPPESPEE